MKAERMLSMLNLACCIIVAGALLWLSGCNTVEGAGEDIQDAGESIEDAAD